MKRNDIEGSSVGDNGSTFLRGSVVLARSGVKTNGESAPENSAAPFSAGQRILITSILTLFSRPIHSLLLRLRACFLMEVSMDDVRIIWTGYMVYRSRLRGFDLAQIESVIRYSNERYFDTATGGSVAVGRHKEDLILIPYEKSGEQLTPVTVHVTSRQQINSRVKSGRFRHE
ncbi:MAG: hypothetical protein PHV28_17380 [Kiritimatiellae bacterium]|nr:hypothetical protein [Kiritimatiellia bacterium]